MSPNRPRVIQVIESEEVRGAGVMEDPSRIVVRYHTLDGELLAECDAWGERQADSLQERSQK